MMKVVSWIDSLPRLTKKRSQTENAENFNQRRQKQKSKSTATTPVFCHKTSGERDSPGSESKCFSSKKCRLMRSATKLIGRRRYTVPDALEGAPVPPKMTESVRAILDDRASTQTSEAMSASWHPDGQYYNTYYYFPPCRKQNSNTDVSRYHGGQGEGDGQENQGSFTLPLQPRPQIRTNPWIRPKSPRVPGLDLKKKCHETSAEAVNGADKQKTGLTDDGSVYSSRSSSGYGSSQDSSPASSVHTPDWHQLNHDMQTGQNQEVDAVQKCVPEIKTVALQCDMTIDKSVACTEEDFWQLFDRDENGNDIPMIDDDEAEYYIQRSDQRDQVSITCDYRLEPYGSEAPVLDELTAKVAVLKMKSDRVKCEMEKLYAQRGEYREHMRFLKQLKLVISNGFEVLL